MGEIPLSNDELIAQFQLKVGGSRTGLLACVAAKEAFSKAWGTGIGKVSFQDLEILRDDNGAPAFTKSPHQGKVFVSLTHTEELAIAQVLLEE